MITEGEAAIPLETTLHAFRNQEKTKQRSSIQYYDEGRTISGTIVYGIHIVFFS